MAPPTCDTALLHALAMNQNCAFTHIRYKYTCKHCEGVESNGPTVKIAPPPAQLLPKSNATEGLLAHIITSKFTDALPLYRQ